MIRESLLVVLGKQDEAATGISHKDGKGQDILIRETLLRILPATELEGFYCV